MGVPSQRDVSIKTLTLFPTVLRMQNTETKLECGGKRVKEFDFESSFLRFETKKNSTRILMRGQSVYLCGGV